jgi:hypothetical protein
VVKDRLASDGGRPALDIGAAVVRSISLADAGVLLAPYEALRPIPAIFAFRLFFGDRLAGAVVYGDEYAQNVGVWERHGFAGKIICPRPGARLPWAHPHSASKLIRSSMALLPGRYNVVAATVDPAIGEVGVIYQAAGFHYVGVMTKGGRAAITERIPRRLVGTRGARALAKIGFNFLCSRLSEPPGFS